MTHTKDAPRVHTWKGLRDPETFRKFARVASWTYSTAPASALRSKRAAALAALANSRRPYIIATFRELAARYPELLNKDQRRQARQIDFYDDPHPHIWVPRISKFRGKYTAEIIPYC